MIYMLGMSHIHPVLEACSAGGIAEQLPKIVNEREPAFVEWEVKPGLLPDRLQVASIYLRHIAAHWGSVLAVQQGPGVIALAPGYQKLLQSIASGHPRSTLFTFIHGEEYIHMSNQEHAVPHDFHLPWRPDLQIAPQRQVVPLECIERQVLRHLKKALDNFNAIRIFHPNLHIVNVVCPPPHLRKERQAGRELVAEKIKSDLMGADCHVLLKYYLLYARAIQDVLLPRRIRSLQPPPETLTADGLLKPEYAGDGMHGNAAYGERVLEQMSKVVEAGVLETKAVEAGVH